MMIDEHESAGGAGEASHHYRLHLRRGRLHDYRAAAGTGRVREDLHHHVHLENNILFPKATIMEGQLVS
jgi:iron-sulfur cluster repair protein YtfE (RIC family)